MATFGGREGGRPSEPTTRTRVDVRCVLALLVAWLVVVQGVAVGVSAAAAAGSAGNATFSESAYYEERGDVVTFTVELTGTTRATVQVGSDDVNYVVEFDVVDGNADGEVTVAWNTYLAVQNAATEVFQAVDGDDSVRNAVRHQGSFDDPERRIDAGQYPLSVEVDNTETDVATANLREPDDLDRSLASLRGRRALATDAVPEHLDADSTVAEGDYVVLQIKTSGVFGYVDSASDLAEGTEGVSVTIEQTNHGNNEDPTVVDPKAMKLLTEPETNRLFLVARTDVTAFEPGERYRATVEIDAAENPYADEDVRLTTSFEVVYRDATIEGAGGAGQSLPLRPADDATIEGTATMADGTELEVEVRSQDDAYLERRTVVVRDGTYSAEFDLSGATPGAEYEVTVREDSKALAYTPAVVRERAAVSMSDQRSDDGWTVVVEDVSVPEGGFVAIYDPGKSGTDAVLGHSEYLPPGEHDAVRVTLSERLDPGTRTLVAALHHDTTGTGQFEFVDSAGSEDGPYERNGQPVTDGATVTVEATATLTATETPTDTPGTTPGSTATAPPDDDTPGSTPRDGTPMLEREWESTPGFGLAAALAALLAGAMLAVRRRE